MADASTGIAALVQSDLSIQISPGWAPCFRGSSAQLIAEGLIPDGFVWPHRTQTLFWENDSFEFSLKRSRPPGIKGPQSIWVNGDFWTLLVFAVGFDYSLNLRKLSEQSGEVCRESRQPINVGRPLELAMRDQKYLQFRKCLLGELSRKRGSRRGLSA